MAASNISVPLQVITDPIKKKRKRFNKNKKKAWRTKIDMTDIDMAFEEKRREERFGGPIAEQSADNLFTIDIGGDLPALTIDKVVAPIEKLSISSGLKPSNRKDRKRTLKCHKLLKGLPGVKAASHKKATQAQHLEKKVRLLKRVDSENGALRDAIKLENIVHQSNKDQKNHRLTRNKKTFVRNQFTKDLWSNDAYKESPVEVPAKVKNAVAESYLTPNIEYLANAMKTKAPRRPSRAATSSIPAVPLPKPGASYNPRFEDHQKLLYEAMDDEVEKRLEKKKRDDYVARVLPRSLKSSHEDNLKEMCQGVDILNGAEPTEHEEEEESDDEKESVPIPKIHEKKSAQERRKMVKRRHLERRIQIAKDKNRRESEVFRVKAIKKELNQVDKIKKRMREKRLNKMKEALGKPKRLSKKRVRPMNIVVPLQTELKRRLLEVKHIANPLEEKYKLMHHRNLLETRGRRPACKTNKRFYKKGKTPGGNLNLSLT